MGVSGVTSGVDLEGLSGSNLGGLSGSILGVDLGVAWGSNLGVIRGRLGPNFAIGDLKNAHFSGVPLLSGGPWEPTPDIRPGAWGERLWPGCPEVVGWAGMGLVGSPSTPGRPWLVVAGSR